VDVTSGDDKRNRMAPVSSNAPGVERVEDAAAELRRLGAELPAERCLVDELIAERRQAAIAD